MKLEKFLSCKWQDITFVTIANPYLNHKGNIYWIHIVVGGFFSAVIFVVVAAVTAGMGGSVRFNVFVAKSPPFSVDFLSSCVAFVLVILVMPLLLVLALALACLGAAAMKVGAARRPRAGLLI